MSARCSSGIIGCDGRPITNAELRPGDRVRVFRSQERRPVKVLRCTDDGITLVEGREGVYEVDLDGACSCILEVAS